MDAPKPIIANIENWKKSIVADFFNNVNLKVQDDTIPSNTDDSKDCKIWTNGIQPISDWNIDNKIHYDYQLLESNANNNFDHFQKSSLDTHEIESNTYDEKITACASVTTQLEYTCQDDGYSNDQSTENKVKVETEVYEGYQFESVDKNQDTDVRSGRNCVSVIFVLDRGNCKKMGEKRGKGGILIERFFCSVSNMIKSLPHIRLHSEDKSTVGNQARRDYMFYSEEEAHIFNSELCKPGGPKSCLPLDNGYIKTLLNTEEDLGFGSDPLLTETEILHLQIHNQAEHLFRHFITCIPVEDKKTVSVKFDSLSDINLFLSNKVRDPSKRTLGALRRDVGGLTLVPDELGYYRLVSSVRMIPKHYKAKFRMITKPVEEEDSIGYKGKTHLLFKSKLNMMRFFTSEYVKDFKELYFDESLIQETEIYKLRELLRMEKAQVKNLNDKVYQLTSSIEQLSEDGFSDMLPSAPWMSLNQILSLNFKDETNDSSKYPSCLTSFLHSPALLEISKGVEGDIRFLFRDCQALTKLYRKLCVPKSDPTQRAMFTPSFLYNDFCLLVFIEEINILNFSIKQVEEELKISGAKIEIRRYGFKARYFDSLSFLRGLTNSNIKKFHRLVIQNNTICFSGGSEDRPTFNGLPCVHERTLLSCLLDDDISAVSGLLKDPLILRVWLDWEGDLVFTTAKTTDTNQLLRDHCRTGRDTGLLRIHPVTVDKGPSGFYLTFPQSVDIRDFFKITDTCQIVGEGKIVFKSKLDLVRCFIDPELRRLYPDIQLLKENINRKKVDEQYVVSNLTRVIAEFY